MAPQHAGTRRILRADPDYRPEDGDMEFRLTYEGVLMGASKSSTRAKHKHEIRCVFHAQPSIRC